MESHKRSVEGEPVGHVPTQVVKKSRCLVPIADTRLVHGEYVIRMRAMDPKIRETLNAIENTLYMIVYNANPTSDGTSDTARIFELKSKWLTVAKEIVNKIFYTPTKEEERARADGDALAIALGVPLNPEKPKEHESVNDACYTLDLAKFMHHSIMVEDLSVWYQRELIRCSR